MNQTAIPPRVLAADEQTLVRRGICSLLGLAGIEVISEASDGAEALEACTEHSPDVVLLDLRMSVYDGLWFLKKQSEQGIEIPTLVLTTFDDDTVVLEVLRLVAEGYSNRRNAELVCLAEGTVKNHISSTLVKLGARDRTNAVLRAIREGILG